MTEGGPEPRKPSRLPRGLAPLGYRNYLLFWIGFVSSNTGRWMELTGAVWLVYELTSSPLLLGLLGIARAAPAILIGPIAGVIVDRVDLRRLLTATQLIGLVNSLALGLLVLFGDVQLWQVYLQVTVQSLVQAFDAACRQTLFPSLVPRGLLSEAVTLSATAGRSSALVGPALGGILIATLGEAAPFLANAGTFLVLVLALALMRGVTSVARIGGASFRVELVDGLRYIARAPILRGLFMLELVFGVFSMNPVMITIVGRETLHVGPEGLGGLLGAPAVGALFGIGALITFGHAPWPGRFVLACTVVYAGALVAFAMAGQYLVAFAILALTGLMDALVSVTRHSVVQLAAPGEMRGRVMANMGTVTRGVSPLAQTQSGFLTGIIGAPMALAVAAGVLVTSAVVTARFNTTLRGFSLAEALGKPAPGGKGRLEIPTPDAVE